MKIKKSPKKQGLILPLKKKFLEKPEEEFQTEPPSPPSLLRTKTLILILLG